MNAPILIADDDPDMRELVADALVARGYTVVLVGDGIELLVSLRALEPSVVVSDVSMPRMTGPEACRQARALGWGTPFIFMTAFASPDQSQVLAEIGPTAIFDKPFDIDAMCEEVDRAIGPRAIFPTGAKGLAHRPDSNAR